ncbi:NAD(P)H-dependent oxidoreductase [Flammeovirga sp. MY04]|uniref:NAD(P)H-dependent oxidoreductase n=1 Tax=Flammeovirga sp. MY04 TaxID=1191459 RepID=UPI003FA582B9
MYVQLKVKRNMKTLVILAHPEVEKSIANNKILNDIKENIDNVEVSDIHSLYPDYKIDVEEEQQKLLAADNVIFQYPFYWYNMPGILKVWFDQVFSYNFAYGSKGDKLKGKNFLLSFTVGGPEESYSPTGYNHFKIEDFTKPMEQTAYLAQMNFLKPIYGHGMVYIPGVYNSIEAVEERAAKQSQRVIDTINGLKEKNAEGIIKGFVKEWFSNFDIMSEDKFFHPFISDQSVFTFPEGRFEGQKGFSDWYAETRKIIKPNNTHTIEKIEVTKEQELFDVQLSIDLEADTTSGEQLKMKVEESWKLAISDNGKIEIREYIVRPL